MVERDLLAVNKHIGERTSLSRNRLEFLGPVQTLSGFKPGLAVLDPQLHPVAVEFDLMAPSLACGRTLDRHEELGRYEIRDRRDFLAFGRRGRRSIFLTFFFCARLRSVAPVRMPDRIYLAAAGLRRHERFWCLAFALRDLLHRPSRRHRSVGVQDIIGLAFLGEFVAMLDQ